MNVHQPFRIVVSARGWRRVKTTKGRGPSHKGAHSIIEPVDYGYVAWTTNTQAEPHRAGFGSFLFHGIHATRARVIRLLADPRVTQVSIRTNQDKTLFTYYKAR